MNRIITIIASISILACIHSCSEAGDKTDIFNEIDTPSGQLCGGYTEQRDVTAEEIDLFNKVLGENAADYTPLSVSTQVVAGLNYKFYCRFNERDGNSPAYRYVTIFQPLQGEPQLSDIQPVE